MSILEEIRDLAQSSRHEVQKAKTQQDLNLARDVKDKKKGFYEYIGDKTKSRENVGSLLNKAGDLVTHDMEKVEVPNAAFASAFASKNGLQESIWTSPFLLWGWLSTSTGCLESLCPWKYSKAIWTCSWATSSRRPCLSRGAGSDDLQRSLPTSTILWLCNDYWLISKWQVSGKRKG